MFRRIFRGRYGSDQLNIALIIFAAALSLLNNILYILIHSSALYFLIGLVYTAAVVFVFLRMFSKNIYLRQAENQKWLTFWNRLKDRSHRYYRCPHCRQQVRVPRHKGKISIRCPRCGEKFIRKT